MISRTFFRRNSHRVRVYGRTTLSQRCASSNNAIGDSMRLLTHGDADVIVTGGLKPRLRPLAWRFLQYKALSAQRRPEKHRGLRQESRRFLMGEAPVLSWKLWSTPRKRRQIYAELIGTALDDAYHITAPHLTARPRPGHARGYQRCRITTADIDYSMPTARHGIQRQTETTHQKVFGERANKYQSHRQINDGHLLGAAGVEI